MYAYSMRSGTARPEAIRPPVKRVTTERAPRTPDFTCPACGRREVRGGYCTGCYTVTPPVRRDDLLAEALGLTS